MRTEVTSLLAACHSAACAPPPAGTGGSTKGVRDALNRAIAAIKAPGSNVDRTKRNSLEYVSHAERTGKKSAPAPAPKKAGALARAWKAVSANTSGPVDDVTPVPEVRRADTNVMDAVKNPRSPAEAALARAYKAKQPKSQMVTRAEARRSRGGKDIPVAASI